MFNFPFNPSQMYGSMPTVNLEKVNLITQHLMTMFNSGLVDAANVGDFDVVEYETPEGIGFSIVWKKSANADSVVSANQEIRRQAQGES